MSEKPCYTPEEMDQNFEAQEYFRLFSGGEASLNKIREQTPSLEITVNKLLDLGTVVGQRTLPLDGEDIILWRAND